MTPDSDRLAMDGRAMLKVFNKHNRDAPVAAKYIGRGSMAGNPFVVGRDGTLDEVCDKFEAWVEESPELKRRLIAYCQGHDLVCFCKPKRCHGDYLLKISNDVERI